MPSVSVYTSYTPYMYAPSTDLFYTPYTSYM